MRASHDPRLFLNLIALGGATLVHQSWALARSLEGAIKNGVGIFIGFVNSMRAVRRIFVGAAVAIDMSQPCVSVGTSGCSRLRCARLGNLPVGRQPKAERTNQPSSVGSHSWAVNIGSI